MSDIYVHGLKYPDKLRQDRVRIESSVVGCLLLDPVLLDESGLSEHGFMTLDARFFFRVVKEIRSAGFESVDSNSLATIQDWQEAIDCKARNGNKPFEKIIQRLTNGVVMDNWENYLDLFIRETILCNAYDMNMLPMDDVTIEGKKFNFIDQARKLSSSEVLELFEIMVDGFTGKEFQNSGVLEKGYIDFNDKWLEELNKGEEMGVPFGRAFEDCNGDAIPIYPALSNMLLGLKPGTLSMIAGYSSAGKSTFFVGLIMSMIATGHKVAYISNEENRSRFQLKCLVWISYNIFHNKALTKRKLASGNHDEASAAAIKQAREYWMENNLDDKILYIQIPDASMKTVKKQVRTLSKDGFDVVIYDTFKMMISDMKNSRSDLDLIKNSRELYNLAVKYDLIMLASMQLAERFKGKLWLDSSTLSNSKQVKEVLENLVLFRNVYKSELSKGSPDYLEPFTRIHNDDGTYTRKEEALSEEENWRVMFVEKSRGGSNSEDTGVALLYRFDGDYSTFTEYCQCSPRHGQLSDNKNYDGQSS